MGHSTPVHVRPAEGQGPLTRIRKILSCYLRMDGRKRSLEQPFECLIVFLNFVKTLYLQYVFQLLVIDNTSTPLNQDTFQLFSTKWLLQNFPIVDAMLIMTF